MTNGEKYTTTKERFENFEIFCHSYDEYDYCPMYEECGNCCQCETVWLDLEVGERIED